VLDNVTADDRSYTLVGLVSFFLTLRVLTQPVYKSVR